MIALSMTLNTFDPHFKVMKFFEDEYRKRQSYYCTIGSYM